MNREWSGDYFPHLTTRDLPLAKEEVHIWCLSLDLPLEGQAHCFSLLSPDEKTRAERFYFDNIREHFIAGRGLLRMLLGKYLGLEPNLIRFDYEPHGRPILKLGEDQPLRFNVSHSEGLGVIILSRDCQVGIDVEHIHPMADMDDLAAKFFAVQEAKWISSLSGPQKEEMFYKVWTCKEAYLKALGMGLVGSLERVEIAPLPESNEGSGIRTGTKKEGWQLGIFTPQVNYQGAVAIQGSDVSIIFQPSENANHLKIEAVDFYIP